MPKVYRTMFEQGGKPRIGAGWCELGVRPPGRLKPNRQPAVADVDLDANDDVLMNNKGMSVFRSLADLPALHSRLVPLHLAAKIRGAAGSEWNPYLGDGTRSVHLRTADEHVEASRIGYRARQRLPIFHHVNRHPPIGTGSDAEFVGNRRATVRRKE
jgi:hypothetical protein